MIKRIVLGVLFSLLIPNIIYAATFGQTTDTGLSWHDATPAGRVFVSEFNLPENGDVSKLSVYIRYLGSGSIKGVIFSKSSSEPSTLLGVTTATSISSGDAWYDLVFSSPVSLTSGNYYLGYIPSASDAMRAYYGPATGHYWKYSTNDYTTPTDWGTTSYTENNYADSIYATYETSSVDVYSTKIILK